MATVTVVTATGRSVTVGRMQGSTPSQAEPKFIGCGVGAGTAVNIDVAPIQEATEARVIGTSSSQTTTTTGDTYQVTGTWSLTSTETITEAFLADGSTKPPSTTANGAISSTSSTSITVTSASGFPGSGNYCIQIDSEVLQVTGGQGTTTWTVTRGFNGSTAATHSNGATITGGNNPGSTAIAAGGSLYVHSTFTGLALGSGDSLAPTFQIKHT